jgi:hypothetical protein
MDTTIAIEEARRVAEAANEEGMFYFSCRGDYWWRAIHTCKNNEVLCALARTHLALALPSNELEVRRCTPLPTKLDPQRNVELDSCFSISARDIELKTPESNQNPQELRILRDINERGAVIFAEMQQQKQTIVQESGNKIDKLPSRMDDYASFVAARDRGKPSRTNNEDDVHAGKKGRDEISRSVVGVAYHCYGEMSAIKQSAHSYSGDLQDSVSARGTAVATVSLGNIFKRENLVKQSKNQTGDVQADWKTAYEKIVSERINKLRQNIDGHLSTFSDDSKRLVGEILAVFSMSHLFTANIVNGFLPVVKDICKILEVNMENIQKVGLSDKQVEQIVGKFRNAEQKIENARAEERKKMARFYREKEKLGNNPTQKALGALLAKYHLTERDIEVSSDTTPKGSPSKPKAGHSPSPSKKR